MFLYSISPSFVINGILKKQKLNLYNMPCKALFELVADV